MKINQTYVRLSVSFHSFLCLIGIVCPEVEMINFKLELMLKRDRHRGKKGGMWECGWARTLSNCAALYHRCVCVCACVCNVARLSYWFSALACVSRYASCCTSAQTCCTCCCCCCSCWHILAPIPVPLPPLPPSLCRVFCNGFHAGRLARPA